MTGPQKRALTLLENQLADDKVIQDQAVPVNNLPTFWIHQGPEEKVKLYPLPKSEEEYKSVEKSFRVSLEKTKINIIHLFGEGVYFPVNSLYSTNSTYSPPDTCGRKYVYQCKVLTGQATIGKEGLKVLPSRSGVILYDSATNNLDKPTLYVIFNDYQAYPEYLITFKDKG